MQNVHTYILHNLFVWSSFCAILVLLICMLGTSHVILPKSPWRFYLMLVNSLSYNIYAASQPSMGAPRLIQRSSRWVQIGWDPLDCDGGFPLSAYVVQYRRSAYYYSYSTLGEVTHLNYTIRELSPLRSYYFRIGRKSSSSLSISYSSLLSVTTLEAGMFLCFFLPVWLSVCDCLSVSS